MKKLKMYLALLGLLSLQIPTYCQSNPPSVYENLEWRNTYDVSLRTYLNRFTKERVYKANGEEIDEVDYETYEQARRMARKCCPCILSYYDTNETLLFEGVYCKGKAVGWYKEYYDSGELKVIGQHKENLEQEWNDFILDGNYDRRIGHWHYFDEAGNLLYKDKWEEGNFIKQVAVGQVSEEEVSEIYDVEITFNGKSVEKQGLRIHDIDNFKFKPWYKNENHEAEFTISFFVYGNYKRSGRKNLTVRDFRDIKVRELIEDLELPKDEKASFYIYIYTDDALLKRTRLNVGYL